MASSDMKFVMNSAAPAHLLSAVKNTLEGVTKDIAVDTSRNAPVDTGALRDSIDSSVEDNNGSPVGIVYSTVDYAAAVELGHSGSAGQPYFAPALYRKR
jgi:hypothetical protein